MASWSPEVSSFMVSVLIQATAFLGSLLTFEGVRRWVPSYYSPRLTVQSCLMRTLIQSRCDARTRGLNNDRTGGAETGRR